MEFIYNGRCWNADKNIGTSHCCILLPSWGLFLTIKNRCYTKTEKWKIKVLITYVDEGCASVRHYNLKFRFAFQHYTHLHQTYSLHSLKPRHNQKRGKWQTRFWNQFRLEREAVTASGREWNNEESHYSGNQVKNDQDDEKYSTCGRLENI